jgi:hypothetical protein
MKEKLYAVKSFANMLPVYMNKYTSIFAVLVLQCSSLQSNADATRMHGAKDNHFLPCYFFKEDKNMAEFAYIPALPLVSILYILPMLRYLFIDYFPVPSLLFIWKGKEFYGKGHQAWATYNIYRYVML